MERRIGVPRALAQPYDSLSPNERALRVSRDFREYRPYADGPKSLIIGSDDLWAPCLAGAIAERLLGGESAVVAAPNLVRFDRVVPTGLGQCMEALKLAWHALDAPLSLGAWPGLFYAACGHYGGGTHRTDLAFDGHLASYNDFQGLAQAIRELGRDPVYHRLFHAQRELQKRHTASAQSFMAAGRRCTLPVTFTCAEFGYRAPVPMEQLQMDMTGWRNNVRSRGTYGRILRQFWRLGFSEPKGRYASIAWLVQGSVDDALGLRDDLINCWIRRSRKHAACASDQNPVVRGGLPHTFEVSDLRLRDLKFLASCVFSQLIMRDEFMVLALPAKGQSIGWSCGGCSC